MRRLLGAALQPAHQAMDDWAGRLVAGQGVVGVAQFGDDFFRLHHRRAAGGQIFLLARLRREFCEFAMGVAQPIGLLARLGDPRLFAGQSKTGLARSAKRAPHRQSVRLKPARSVDQRAMHGRIDQSAVIMLAMDFNQRARHSAQGLRAHRLVVDESAGAAVRHLHAAQNQLAFGVNVVRAGSDNGGVIGSQREHRRHLPLRLALAHKRTIPARAKRQREGVKQDRFSSAGLAGKHSHPGRWLKVEPIDQNDIAD